MRHFVSRCQSSTDIIFSFTAGVAENSWGKVLMFGGGELPPCKRCLDKTLHTGDWDVERTVCSHLFELQRHSSPELYGHETTVKTIRALSTLSHLLQHLLDLPRRNFVHIWSATTGKKV